MKKYIILFFCFIVFSLFGSSSLAYLDNYGYGTVQQEIRRPELREAVNLYLNAIRLIDGGFFRDLSEEEAREILEDAKASIEKIMLSIDKQGELVPVSFAKRMLERSFEGVGVVLGLPEQKERFKEIERIIKEYFPSVSAESFSDPFVKTQLVRWLAKKDPRLEDLYKSFKNAAAPADGILIKDVVPESPAAEAGLKAGWRIIGINGQSVAGLPLEEIKNLLRGKAGSEIELTVVPSGRPFSPAVINLRRKEIEISVHQLEGRMIRPGIGYIKLREFYRRCENDFNRLYDDLKARGAKAFVLDLRGNPGGFIDAAFAIAGKFLPHGYIIFSVRSQRKGDPGEHLSNLWGDPRSQDEKLVVLVDEKTASASEIVCAALQDHKRAVIVGTKTFGKGSLQMVPGLGEGYSLKITMSLYFSPVNQRVIEGVGITPDIEIPSDKVLEKAIEVLLSGGEK